MALCMAVILPFVVQTEVNAASKADIAVLMKKFPDGKYWDHVGSYDNNPDGWTDTPCPHVLVQTDGEYDYYVGIGYCNEFGGDVQCAGFVNRLVYEAYGTENYQSWEKTSLDKLKAGDVVRYKLDMHTIFVTSVDGENVTYGDCNANFSDCQIKWNQHTTKSEIADSLTAVYAAPTALSVPFRNHSAISTARIRANNEITVRGIGEGGTEKYVYQFSVLSPDTGYYTILGEYSDEAVFRYTPPSEGVYVIKAQVRDSSGSTADREFEIAVTADSPVAAVGGQKVYFEFREFGNLMYSMMSFLVLLLTTKRIYL